VDCKARLGHTRQCSNDPREANSGMRDSSLDLPDKDEFVLVHSSILLPVQIAHRVKLASFGPRAPNRHEGTVNSLLIEEISDGLRNLKHVVLDVVEKTRIADAETLLKECI
jgi:hypothetical protein